MKHLALILALTTTPAYAGGPVLTLEETYTAPAPDRDNSWIVPAIILLGIVAIAASGGGDDAPATPDDGPKPCVFTGEGGC
jgi:hypothetical protein